MSATLPWHDAQFWIATGAMLAAVVWAVWRVRRGNREAESACANCPKSKLVAPPARRPRTAR